MNATAFGPFYISYGDSRRGLFQYTFSSDVTSLYINNIKLKTNIMKHQEIDDERMKINATKIKHKYKYFKVKRSINNFMLCFEN